MIKDPDHIQSLLDKMSEVYRDGCDFDRNLFVMQRYWQLHSILTQALKIAKEDKAIVPREPTDDIVKAGLSAGNPFNETPRDYVRKAYTAMVAAAEKDKQ